MTISISTIYSTVYIDPPAWGYRVDINMYIKMVQTRSGWKLFDGGKQYDYRICTIPKCLLNKTQTENLTTFLNTEYQGRNQELSVQLGVNSGFYMFGPDKGDSYLFNCRIIDRKQTTLLYDPWMHTEGAFEFHLIELPETPYELPEQVFEGNLSIGNISNLKWPQSGIKLNTRYGLLQTSGHGEYVESIDVKTNIYDSEFTIECNQSNAAALVDFLCSDNGRAYDINIVAPENMYLFGVENGHDKTFTTKLLMNKISITHNNNEQFSIPLKFWMKS